MVWERQGLPPHPPLRRQKPEGWAGLGLGWELAAASPDCSSLWRAQPRLKPVEMSCCHLAARSCRDTGEVGGSPPPHRSIKAWHSP